MYYMIISNIPYNEGLTANGILLVKDQTVEDMHKVINIFGVDEVWINDDDCADDFDVSNFEFVELTDQQYNKLHTLFNGDRYGQVVLADALTNCKAVLSELDCDDCDDYE